MNLWEYLKKHIVKYKNRIAFANSELTYADILTFEKNSNERKLTLCVGDNKEKQAIEILKCIASKNVAVPAVKEYGRNLLEYIEDVVQTSSQQNIVDLAFLMFTSGTTGIPKGVMLTDENIISNIEYIKTYFNLKGMKKICIARPLMHIAVLTGELLYALCNGLTIYFYEEAFMPQRLISYLCKNEIDVFCATPTLYQILALASKNNTIPIKIGVLSGEVLTSENGKNIANTFSNTQFYNVYGLTEHSPRVSALCPEDFLKKPGSVGKAIGDVQVKIVDGELLVKSPSVMKGYYLDELRTKEKLHDGWLQTGDCAHFDFENYLYIDGRKDEMLIKSGLNFYPEEIENAVKKLSNIIDCVVFGERTDSGMTICMKYIGSIEVKDLRKQLIGRLNPNIIPSRIEKVEEIACTASGKKIRI